MSIPLEAIDPDGHARPETGNTSSVPPVNDITMSGALTSMTDSRQAQAGISDPTHSSGLRSRQGNVSTANRPAGRRASSPDTIEHIYRPIIYTPMMGVLTALICYGGALKPLRYFHDSSPANTPSQDISNVSPIYGPGAFFSWLLAVNTMMFDIYYYDKEDPTPVSPWFDKGRFALVISYGLMAYLEQIGRAWKGDFSPSEAAARYVGDKAFESFAIIFATSVWRDYLKRRLDRRNDLPRANAPDRPSPYVYWPPFVFLLAWAIGRACEHQLDRDIYDIPLEHDQYKLTWAPLIPKNLRPISLAIGMLWGLFSTEGNIQTRFVEGFSKIVWVSSAVLHCGLFGTVGSLRLTSIDPRARDQWMPILIMALGAVWQYWKEVVKLPEATWSRFKCVFKWRTG